MCGPDPTSLRELTEPDRNGGVYLLVIEVVSSVRVRVGALGERDFEPGCYVYTGSARRNLRQRVQRHFRREKHVRWHVDYLTSHPAARVVGAILLRGTRWTECATNQAVKSLVGGQAVLPGFGSSDCRGGCGTHLWRVGSDRSVEVVELRGIEPLASRVRF